MNNTTTFNITLNFFGGSWTPEQVAAYQAKAMETAQAYAREEGKEETMNEHRRYDVYQSIIGRKR